MTSHDATVLMVVTAGMASCLSCSCNFMPCCFPCTWQSAGYGGIVLGQCRAVVRSASISWQSCAFMTMLIKNFYYKFKLGRVESPMVDQFIRSMCSV